MSLIINWRVFLLFQKFSFIWTSKSISFLLYSKFFDISELGKANEIVTGDSIFCATGITSGDLVAGIKIHDNDFVSETLVTHKSSGLKKVIKLKQNL